MANKKHESGPRKIKAIKHSPPLKNKQPSYGTITVVESPVDRFKESLDSILEREHVVINFSNASSDEEKISYAKLNDGREVYVVEKDSEDHLHGHLSFDPLDKQSYSLYLIRSTASKPEFHDYSNLRRIIVMSEKKSD